MHYESKSQVPRWLAAISGLLVFMDTARAEMIHNGAIGNDPMKEKLCAARAKGKVIPFEIDSRYVARARSQHPDATFIAIDGISPQLIECYLRSGTGRYEPASMSPEQGFWHTIKPNGPGIGTQQAQSMSIRNCTNAALSKSSSAGLSHSVNNAVIEVDINRAGKTIAGHKAERYDIVVQGTSFYKSSGPDLATKKFTCLLSRALQVKAVELK